MKLQGLYPPEERLQWWAIAGENVHGQKFMVAAATAHQAAAVARRLMPGARWDEAQRVSISRRLRRANRTKKSNQ